MSITFSPENHEYLIDGVRVPCVSDILKAEHIIEDKFFKDDYGANKGRMIHDAIRMHLQGTMETPPQGIVGEYFEGFLKFATDFKINEIVYLETPLFSKRWNFCGTPDLFALIGKSLILSDWKSGASLHPATALQLAMYKILVEENQTRKVKEMMSVKLSPGKYSLGDPKIYNNPHSVNVAYGVINEYYWKKQHLRQIPEDTSVF